MNPTLILSEVSRVNVGALDHSHDQRTGEPRWHRCITCHGGGKVLSLCLSSDTETGLHLHMAPQDLDAVIEGLSVEQLDELAVAIRAERDGRRPDRCSRCGNVTVLYGLPGESDPPLCLGCQTTPTPDSCHGGTEGMDAAGSVLPHCDCGVALLDDKPCPKCGVAVPF